MFEKFAAFRIIERNLKVDPEAQENNAYIKAGIFKSISEKIFLLRMWQGIWGFTLSIFAAFFTSMGITYRQYLGNIRVAYAQNIIKATGMSCTSACYEAGFNSYSAFLRAFKRVTGASPGK